MEANKMKLYKEKVKRPYVHKALLINKKTYQNLLGQNGTENLDQHILIL